MKAATMKAAVISENAPKQIAEIKEIDVPEISEDRMLIKTKAVGINPTDWKHVVMFGSNQGILGSDASGIVERVGLKVKGFEKGDIIGTFDHGNVDFIRGKFAEYALVHPDAAIKADMSIFNQDEQLTPGKYESSKLVNFEALASVPLGLTTISVSFNHSLGIPQDKSANSNNYILIWGGSTASGILAIQIAKLVYGLKVITTCSGKNMEFVKSLGADEVFDYNDSDVTTKISKVGDGKIKFALDTAALIETHQSTYDSLAGSEETVKFDSLLGFNETELKNSNPSIKVQFVRTVAYNSLGEDVTLLRDYKVTPELLENHRDFWYNLLPPVISKLKTANLRVLDSGLDSVNEGLEMSRQNKLSAEKVVFRI